MDASVLHPALEKLTRYSAKHRIKRDGAWVRYGDAARAIEAAALAGCDATSSHLTQKSRVEFNAAMTRLWEILGHGWQDPDIFARATEVRRMADEWLRLREEAEKLLEKRRKKRQKPGRN